jgi:MFS family permease
MIRASADGYPSRTAVSRPFVAICAADLIVRSAYQMGKTPLLPIFAATLGATDLYLGFIVSVSTLTGMVLKPVVGLLSDRWGRRPWLLLGTMLFGVMPFFYLLIHSPGQLLAIRLVHGTATAIYGPVTVAYVVELADKSRAESIGWFSMARSGGYILGPALAGWLLLAFAPRFVFVIIGGLSLMAFIPILMLGETHRRSRSDEPQWPRQLGRAAGTVMQSGALWLASGLEMVMFVGLYAARTFLPLFGLTIGLNVAQIGLYFALQESITVLLKAPGGRLGDKRGHLKTALGGMALLALAFILISTADRLWMLFLSAILAGAGQGLIAPNTIGLLSRQLHSDCLGTGLGVMGTLQNGSKVLGPVVAGLLVASLDYRGMFLVIGYGLLATTALLALLVARHRVGFSSRLVPLDFGKVANDNSAARD